MQQLGPSVTKEPRQSYSNEATTVFRRQTWKEKKNVNYLTCIKFNQVS